MRTRTSLYRQMIPGTRAIIEALPLRRVRRHNKDAFPVQGEIVHVLEHPEAPFVPATVIRVLKKIAQQEQQYELLLDCCNTIFRPKSKLIRLPQQHRYVTTVARVYDLVLNKLGTRLNFRVPPEEDILRTFVTDQLQIRPDEHKDSSTTSSSNSAQSTTGDRQVRQPIVLHREAHLHKFLQIVSFDQYLPGIGVKNDHLTIQVRHARWQRPLRHRTLGFFILQGYYNGSTVALCVFDPKTSTYSRLLVDRYEVTRRSTLEPPLTALNTTQLFNELAKEIKIIPYAQSRRRKPGKPRVWLALQESFNRWQTEQQLQTTKLADRQRAANEVATVWRQAAEARRLLCQRARVRRSWVKVEKIRRAKEKATALNTAVFQEWHQMRLADRECAHIRPYLTIPYAQLMELQETFRHFDKDGNNTISAAEFQDMIYEVKGEVLDKKGVKAALKEVDRDGNGVIDFNEFVWWYVNPRSQYPTKGGLMGFFLKLQLDIKKFSRTWQRNRLADEAKAKQRRAERDKKLKAVLEARRIALALRKRTLRVNKEAKATILAEQKSLKARRLDARARAIAAVQRAKELAALKTPAQREAYRLAHLTDAERQVEEERKAIERARISKKLEAEAKIENERQAKRLLEEQEAQEREKEAAAARRLQEQVEEARRKAAEIRAREEEKKAEEERVAKEKAEREELKAKALEAKKAKEAKEAEEMEALRLAQRERALANMTEEEREAEAKEEKERQLMRLAEQKMAKQMEAQKAMQKKLERADRARRRAEKEKKRAAKKKRKQIGKDSRKRNILAKRSSAKR